MISGGRYIVRPIIIIVSASCVSLTLALVMYCTSAIARDASRATRSFTVRDSIELTRVRSPSPYDSVDSTALFSKDRSQILILTRRGDLERNINVESLLVFSKRDIEEYLALAARAPKPGPRTVISVDVRNDWGAISEIRWVDNTQFGFIAEGDNQRNQVFIADANAGRVTQLTRSSTHVASFAIAADRIAYYARVSSQVPQVVPIVEQSLFQLLRWDSDPNAAPLQLFQASLSSLEPQRVDLPEMRLINMHKRIWLSPSGSYAVTLAPAVNAPSLWAEYRIPHYEMFGFTDDKVRSDPTSWDLIDRTRFYFVDLKKNIARPLLDAPSGWLARSCTPMNVFWSNDEKSVIVSNTFLPLRDEEGESRSQRAAAPAIAEIEVGSGVVRPIVFQPLCPGDRRGDADDLDPIVAVDWDEQTRSVRVARRSHRREQSFERYIAARHGWHRVGRTTPKKPSALTISLRQTMNERPKVHAFGGECGCSREFLDPAPWADQFTFGRAEVLRWRDRNNIEWKGGVLYPPSFVDGVRYPLVVQTHGFRTEEFLIDGPHGGTTAMAAQPLVNSGFVVLQIEDNSQADTVNEAELYAEGYRAGIDELVGRGIIDPARVGMIAFSRSGLPVIRLLGDHPDLLLAVVIADAGWWGYLLDLALLNYPQDLAAQARRVAGGSPSASELPEWIARNPVYRLPRARTAVRIETSGGVIKHWEHYAVLKNAGRPVDFVYYPYGGHVLMKPAERLESQGGAVDWFRFWLKGERDYDPEKADQYMRWCKLPAPRPDTGSEIKDQSAASFRQQQLEACTPH